MSFLRRIRRIARTVCFGMALALCCSGYAQAQDAKAAPPPSAPPGSNVRLQADQNFAWDSNPLKLARGEQAIWGSITTATLVINGNTPVSQFSLSNQVEQNVFDDSQFNATNFHETLGIGRTNERWHAAVTGRLDYDTTRTSEFTSYGISAPDVRHTGLMAAPELSFKPNSIEKIGVRGSASRSTYDNNAFIDYEFYSANPYYSRIFDEMNTGTLNIIAQRYQSQQGLKNKTDSIGPSLGWTLIISPRLTTTLTAGAERSTQENAASVNTSSRWNYVFSGNLLFKGEQDTITVKASRAQQPFGNGSAALFTNFNVAATHQLNERLALNGGASYRYTDYLITNGINLDSETDLSGGLSYRVLEHVDVNAAYRYMDQSLTNVSGSVRAHAVILGLTYRPNAWAL